MNEYAIQKGKGILAVIWFGFCLWLIIDGQATGSMTGLLRMLAGLTGLLALLYLYNRGFARKGSVD